MGARAAPNIVVDKLVFCVDASNTNSYISSSLDVFNLQDRNIKGNIENGLFVQAIDKVKNKFPKPEGSPPKYP